MMHRLIPQRFAITFVLAGAAALIAVAFAAPAAADDHKKNTPPPGFHALFNGEDLTGWEGLVGNPKSRREMSPQERASAQMQANQRIHEHWSVNDDGVLVYDGQGKSLATAQDYGDFEMYVDWKIKENGDSGLYLRGSPQVQIWDPAHHDGTGSGGLFNNKKHLSKPIRTTDNPIGEWNTFRIRMFGDRVWVWLNDELVTPGVVMENYWERDKPIYRTEQIELQHHGNRLEFKNIYLKNLWPEDKASETLFDGSDLSQFRFKKGGWHINDDGVLAMVPDESGYIWTKKAYDDFVLDLDYKTAKDSESGNSGIFFRTDPSNSVQGGFEIQILNSAGKEKLGKHDAGALYDAAAPSTNNLKPAGEWNHVKLICEGPHITVITNGVKTLQVNIDDWKKAKTNPDGTENKFKTPLSELPRTGHIGFQDHGNKVWFRNVEITPLPIK